MSSDSPTTSASNREIAIYWDFENVPLPASCSAAVAAKAIVNAVSKYGRITDRRLYYNFESNTIGGPRDTASLDSSGFDLVNTPRRNQKETLDKKLIADVLTFAWDSAVRNDKSPCVVLLTSDGDYAYTLSKLRDRGVMTIVMVGSIQSVASILVDTADVALSLRDDVIANYRYQAVTPTKPKKPVLDSLPVSSSAQYLKVLCSAIHRLESSEDQWCDYGAVSLSMQTELRKYVPENQVKNKAKDIRSEAVAKGLIEVGKRLLDQPVGVPRKIIVGKNPALRLSLELYARLLPGGEKLIGAGSNTTTTTAAARGRARTVYVRQIPRQATIENLVDHLSSKYGVVVHRALMDVPPNPAFKLSAHVELSSSEEASYLIKEADKKNSSGVVFQGSLLSIFPNTRSHALDRKGNANVYYERADKTDKVQFSSKKTAPTEYADTSNDVAYFCAAIQARTKLAAPEDQGWVDAGVCGNTFMKFLRMDSSSFLVKEETSARYRNARDNAAEKGLVEISRRVLETTTLQKEYISISPRNLSFRGDGISPVLSHEMYLRLLPDGQELAKDVQNGPHISSPVNKNTYTTDITYLCVAILMAETVSPLKDEWVNAGLPANSFIKYIRKESRDSFLTKEDASTRLKTARSNATKQGLLQIGRRQLRTVEKKVVVVPPHGLFPNGDLSSEIYLRLSSEGRALAMEKQPTLGSDGSKADDASSLANKSILFISNFPPDASAVDVVRFFETCRFRDLSVLRVEMEERDYKGTIVRAAHIMFESLVQAKAVLDMSKLKQLFFCGRQLFAVVDRATLDDVTSRRSDHAPGMSFAKPTPQPVVTSEALHQVDKLQLESGRITPTDTVSILTERSAQSMSLRSNEQVEDDARHKGWFQPTEFMGEPALSTIRTSDLESEECEGDSDCFMTERTGTDIADLLGLDMSSEPVDPFAGLLRDYSADYGAFETEAT